MFSPLSKDREPANLCYSERDQNVLYSLFVLFLMYSRSAINWGDMWGVIGILLEEEST
jgi:hypothetical protein